MTSSTIPRSLASTAFQSKAAPPWPLRLEAIGVREEHGLDALALRLLVLDIAADEDLLHLVEKLEAVLDLLGIDVLAALGDDQVLGPSFQVDVVLLVHVAEVARL